MARVYPQGGHKNWICSQDGPRCFQEWFWRGFGGLLEAPWGAQERPKRGQNRCWEGVFLKSKKHSYNKWSWKQFLLVFGAPQGSKNLHFALEGLQKPAFQEVAFSHRLEIGFGWIWEARLGPSWSQVGPYRGSKLPAQVTSMLS